MVGIEEKRLGTPETPVTVFAERFGQAGAVGTLYKRAVQGDASARAMLAVWAQRVTPPVGCLVAPPVTDALQMVAEALGTEVSPGLAVTVETAASVNGATLQEASWPERFKLPCRDCGYVFLSRPRGGRLPRTCGGRCFPYMPRAVDHPRGYVQLYSEGFGYRSRRADEDPIFLDAYSTTVLCAHPDCLRCFVATKPNREYCELHRLDHRQKLLRLRASGSPKHERYRFRLPRSLKGVPAPVQVAPTATGAIAQLRKQEWAQARTESELVELALMVGRGLLVAEHVTGRSGD